MTLGQVFQWACTTLKSHQIEDYKLEARILLGSALHSSAVDIYNKWELNLSSDQITVIQNYIDRRIKNEPTAYITNHKEFYRLDFYIDKQVMIPRPETELLVDLAIKYISKRPAHQNREYSVIDVGTGCGAIAIALSIQFPDIHLFAIDISEDALAVAKLNSQLLNVPNQIAFLHGDLLNPIQKPADLIVANLPYIQSSSIQSLAPEIRNYEPANALDGGRNGLNLIQLLLTSAIKKMSPDGALLLEFGFNQKKELSQLIDLYLPAKKVSFHPDGSSNPYIVCIEI